MTLSPEEAAGAIASVRQEIAKAMVGQHALVDQVLASFLAGGHVLLEGVPGLGKTLLVKSLAAAFSGSFQRIQFTPDLMPADVMGHSFFDARQQIFTTRRGPVFANLVLADEINRAPAKTQAALLEAMQERQVTIEGETHQLPDPFMVLATQNPVEQEGTYPLPEAQLDRFLMKVLIDYPAEAEELAMVRQVTSPGTLGDSLATDSVRSVLTPQQLHQVRLACSAVLVEEPVAAYAVSLVRATRSHPSLSSGAGPRGGIALVRAARAYALLAGRDFTTPDDVKDAVLPVLRHRVGRTAEAEIEGRSCDSLLKQLLEQVPAPR